MTKKAKILVVDDDERNLRLIEAMLTPFGYDVIFALTGETALSKAREISPDVILLDVLLPEMDGFEVAKRLKDDEKTKIIPIVMVTALKDVEDRVKALGTGADDFLSKPVEKTELRARVKSLLKVKAYNDHMRNYQQKLEEAVAERTQELHQAYQKIKASLEEKDVMLKEIHHRVKNNLQIITSLLRIQSSQMKDQASKEILRISQNRIKSMALIHDSLYRSQDLANINFSDYLNRYKSHLISLYKEKLREVDFRTDIQDVHLDINKAIPCGLLINELVTNSLKHAFPNNKKGEIIVRMSTDDNQRCQLTVRDTGIGISKEVDLHEPKKVGMRLVKDLVLQLHGTIKFHMKKGTTVQIMF